MVAPSGEEAARQAVVPDQDDEYQAGQDEALNGAVLGRHDGEHANHENEVDQADPLHAASLVSWHGWWVFEGRSWEASPARQSLVAEVSDPSEEHRHAGLVRRSDRILVPDRSAGLRDGGDPGRDTGLYAVREGEERV